MRFAYADPPYPGKAARYYSGRAEYAGEVDHAELVRRLVVEYPDGWALSTSAEALQTILALCPAGARVAAWFRGERPTRSYWPLAAWEPVVYVGGRAYLSPLEERRLDALVHVARARRTDALPTIGAKPAAFAFWLFGLLGAQPGDALVDLFPGSGGVSRAWELFAGEASRRAAALADMSRAAEHDVSHTPASATAQASRGAAALRDVSLHAGAARREAS